MAYTNIDKSTEYFNTNLWTGNGTSQSFTGIGFQPDWVWTKGRSHPEEHCLTDVVRGTTKELRTNRTDGEFTSANNITSFDSDGFSVGSGGIVNENGRTFVGWSWKGANGTASNTNGSITSTVSASTTSGVSIVGYTGNGSDGATVGHGLGATPACIIIKNRDDSASSFWCVYHQGSFVSQSDPGVLYLNTDVARSADTNVFGLSTVTINSNVFSLGNYNGSNGSSDNMIAYCFAEKKGFSKFGSYTGNGSSDGVFVYTGFKPAWVMIKKSSGTNEWGMWDNTRSTFNDADDILYANLSNAEATNNANGLDFVSNGFKIRASGDLFNASGGSYIYMCFAENPFVTSTGIAGTAR